MKQQNNLYIEEKNKTISKDNLVISRNKNIIFVCIRNYEELERIKEKKIGMF